MKLIMVLYLNTGIIMSQNLFFSEYAEGSSNNKYLEIYNGGSETINLNNYQLINCRNGCDSWEHFHPFNEGTALNAADVWVFCAVDANDVIKAECNQTISNNSIFNGDDVWAIQEINTSTILDKIGEIGDDPGSGWNVAGTSNATKDHTLVRKESVLSGNIDWAASAGTNTNNSEWIVLEKDDFTNLGSHTCNACGESTSTCNDSSACNFGDEGECTYPNTGYDCDGNCTVGEDCAGECGGDTVIDECGICNGLGAVYDCGCESLTEGTCDCDGNELDECDICGGPGAIYECGCSELNEDSCDCNFNVLDCLDICGGNAILDNCGACDNDNTNDCTEDCAGIWGGNATIDECGVCGGPGAIYECGCSELNEGTCDCNDNVLDACGDCGGSIIDSLNCNLALKTVRPDKFRVINAYPNPFNSNTTITLQNMGNTFVKLDIIDLNGHIIDSIYSGYLYEKSTHTFLWDASENNSGIYIARISNNEQLLTHKIILLK